MTKAMLAQIRDQLIKHEGIRLKPYRCTSGKLTIGVGRNLDDKGITTEEAHHLLDNDIRECERQLTDAIPEIYLHLNNARKCVLLNMCFNLGLRGLLSFKNTLRHIQAGEWEQASAGMLSSLWAKQVGYRAEELAAIMRTGYL